MVAVKPDLSRPLRRDARDGIPTPSTHAGELTSLSHPPINPHFLNQMEYDRKSGVSSFYGDRRPSYDALHNPAAPNAPTHRARADSSSSFFNPGAGLPPGAAHSAGYNRQSYYDAGRQEPVKGYGYDDPAEPAGDEWDVYADFNNAGPRYSTAFGMGNGDARCVIFLSIKYSVSR